ncbi:hypothetical protein PIB30_096441 [Stylosanthes scabra]|uniref:Benzyl alcohol O-benzoyltransferase n=1 Tax=Stylosanthes scabra TaxID=79078 RepID=A0ABU6ZUP8_9FABA|nr:hypothetical protein [Stylosanthes scabra]
MVDATGLEQFMSALADMARGAHQPSILPIWQRELLFARNPPQISCNHPEYDQLPINTQDRAIISSYEKDMTQRSFFFGQTDIASLHGLVPPHHGHCTRFELITACIWCCRTKALQLAPEDEVRMMCIVNARDRFNPKIPIGYYGNVFVYPAAVTTVKKLCENPLGYAVELIKKVKAEVTEEYVRSVADLMVTKRRPLFTTVGSFIVSNLTRVGLIEVDFGWGKALYAGVSKGGAGPSIHDATFYMDYQNENGEEGVLFPIYLPSIAMERFEKELGDMLGGDLSNNQQPTKTDEIPTLNIIRDKGSKPKFPILKKFHLGERTSRVPVRSDRPVFGQFTDSIPAFSRAISACRPIRFHDRTTVEPVRPSGPNRFTEPC